jgi:hypothetical protein
LRQFIVVLATLLAAATCLAAAAAARQEKRTPKRTAPARARALQASRSTSHAAGEEAALRYLGKQVRTYQRETWRWQVLMGVPRTDTYGRVLMELSVPDAEKAVALWRRHAADARRQAQHPPHLGAFLCIHEYEASWTDAGGPYYGGLQMDYGFMEHYGSSLLRTKGTADHWTPIEQIWVAERAYRSGRGFYPWPNTARYCGLI